MRILLIVAGLCLAKTVAAGVTIRTAEENGSTYRWFEEMVPMRDGVKLDS